MDHPRGFDGLVRIMERLRGPQGCPWDREQTFQTLRPYLIEETYEVAEAIDRGDRTAHCEELGDLLLQIVFQAQLAGEEGAFTIDEVVESINAKLIRRHPHVFGEEEAATADDVLVHWERAKRAEKASQSKDDGVATSSALDGVPTDLPALAKAEKLGSRASRVGFDWKRAADVLDKVDEELAELKQAIAGAGDDREARVREELGDLLFATVNLARKLGVDPEGALAATNVKFERRFREVEAGLARRGRSAADASLAELEALWVEAKRSGG